jgi:hypothetical protein
MAMQRKKDRTGTMRSTIPFCASEGNMGKWPFSLFRQLPIQTKLQYQYWNFINFTTFANPTAPFLMPSKLSPYLLASS